MNLWLHSKHKEFTNVRKWIVHNLDNDPVRMYRRIYDSLYEFMILALYLMQFLSYLSTSISQNLWPTKK